MCCNRAAGGRIALLLMVRRPPSAIASTAGAAAGSGGGSSPNWSLERIPARKSASTRPPSERIARRRAEKGGEGSGHRALAWRSDHENPCPDRRMRARRRASAHTREQRRHLRRTEPSGHPVGAETAHRRQGIRRQQPAELPAGAANRGRHPVHRLAQATDPLRPPSLSPAQQDRTRLLLPEGLSTHRHPLRQTRPKLPRRRGNRSRHPMVDLNELDPRPAPGGSSAAPGRSARCRGGASAPSAGYRARPRTSRG